MAADVKRIKIEGRGVYVTGDDIDTDQIIPARFMRCVTFDGLGKYAFNDVRFTEDGKSKGHVLDKAACRGASILISNNNFGCGSSREHAPQALKHFGFKAFIAESFAEIFAGNCATLGLPAVSVTKDVIEKLAAAVKADPQTGITIDLVKKEISCAGKSHAFTMPEASRMALLNGTWDTVFELIKNKEEIEAAAKKIPYMNGFAF
ncbi:MAG: 3-isopropylmalate dehydratase small subunit [Spirochaetaceae bacterium]|nr:MAG: 3-isopropylmalate dehydratase small subunit [Spirochaetaceae bacterium]